MPTFPAEPPKPYSKENKGLKNGELWALILLTTIGTGGFFAWYSYIAPLITDVAGWGEYMVGYAMILAGLGMVVGNFVGAKMAELISPLKAVALSLTAMVGLLLLNSVLAFNPYVVLVMTFLMGLAAFTVSTPIQMAIINTAKGNEMLGSSMNQSAFNMGNASGAYLAGLPMALGFSVVYAGVVGAALAGMGVLMAVGIIVYRRQRAATEYRKMAFNS